MFRAGLSNGSLTDWPQIKCTHWEGVVCHMCCIGSYWLHGKCTQIFTGDFFVCGRWGAWLPPAALCGGTKRGCSIRFCQSLWCDYARTNVIYLVEVSSVLYCCPLAWTVPCLAFFFLCSAGIAVGFYGNGETSDGIHRLTYSLRHANRTVAGVQDRVSTKANG